MDRATNPSDNVGDALLVCNNYKGTHLRELPFTSEDVENLEELLKKHGYAVITKRNLFHIDFVTELNEFATKMKSQTATGKRLLVYFSGHGNKFGVTTQDGEKVEISLIINYFKHINNGMVKMFFFDACRGKEVDPGKSVSTAGRSKPKGNGLEYDKTACLKVPEGANILLAYGSTEGFVSVGDPVGSLWTNCFIEAVKESDGRDDILHILTTANKLMCDKKVEERKVHEDVHFQTAEFISTLTDYVYFQRDAPKTPDDQRESGPDDQDDQRKNVPNDQDDQRKSSSDDQRKSDSDDQRKNGPDDQDDQRKSVPNKSSCSII